MRSNFPAPREQDAEALTDEFRRALSANLATDWAETRRLRDRIHRLEDHVQELEGALAAVHDELLVLRLTDPPR